MSNKNKRIQKSYFIKLNKKYNRYILTSIKTIRRILRKIKHDELDNSIDVFTLLNPEVVDSPIDDRL